MVHQLDSLRLFGSVYHNNERRKARGSYKHDTGNIVTKENLGMNHFFDSHFKMEQRDTPERPIIAFPFPTQQDHSSFPQQNQTMHRLSEPTEPTQSVCIKCLKCLLLSRRGLSWPGYMCLSLLSYFDLVRFQTWFWTENYRNSCKTSLLRKWAEKRKSFEQPRGAQTAGTGPII